MNSDMELRQLTWQASVRLAAILSAVAALAAVVVATATALPDHVIVLTVIAIGFTASWIRSGRIARDAAAPAVVRPRHAVAHVGRRVA